MTADVLAGAQRCLHAAARRVSADGADVRYVRGTYVPGQRRCLDVFEAVDAAVVRRRVNDAQLPYRSVDRATEHPTPGTERRHGVGRDHPGGRMS